jgi:CYTH domain-containing protein
MKEIERKFTVKPNVLEVLSFLEPKKIQQGYLMDKAGKTVRVRTKGEKGFLTIKGKTTGITRTEFEYEIPYADAIELLTNFCEKTLSKERYKLTYKENTWEIDVFHDSLEGLIVAEIELENEADEFEKPNWVLEEVSYDPRYYNSQLVKEKRP